MNKKKLLHILGASAVIGSSIPFVMSCTLVEPVYEKQEYVSIVDAANTAAKKFDHDYSYSLGEITTDTSYIVSNGFVGTEFKGEPKYEIKENKSSDSTSIKESDYILISPSYTWRTLVLAEKFILFDKDGNKSEFDNDKHEVGEVAEGQKPDNPLVQLTSNDLKSINNSNFNQKLADAVKMQVVVKKGLKWVNNKGELTKYDIVPEDFYYGWMRKELFDAGFRHKHGGSEAIDTGVIKEFALGSGSQFDPGSHISNDYLLRVFGINRKTLKDESKFLQKVEGTEEKAITFESLQDGTEANFLGFFDKILHNSTYFNAVSSQFIDERTKKDVDSLASNASVEDEKLKHGKRGETGDALKYGYYWYGQEYDTDQLYASPYLPSLIDTNRKEYIRNPHYAQTGWKEKESSALKKIIQKYNAYPDKEQYNNAAFKNFQEGSISVIGFNTLSETNKSAILKDPSNIHFRSTQDKGKLIGDLFRDVIPGPINLLEAGTDFNNGTAEKKYYFNETFAKLILNTDKKTIANGLAKPYDYTYSQRNIAFWSIVDNAWNQYAYVRGLSQTAAPWVGIYSPDDKLGGSENNNDTARKFYEDINKTFAVDKDGNRFYEKTMDEQRLHYLANLQSSDLQFQAPNFDKLKKAMKELLDDFYAQNNIPATEKIEFSLNNRYRNESSKKQTTLQAVAKAINALDPRLNVIAQVPFNPADVWNALILGASGAQIGGWSNDYEGAGTVLDGISQMEGPGFYLAIPKFAELPETDPLVKSFPVFYKYSKDFVAELNKEQDKEGFSKNWVPVSDWKLANNSYNVNVLKVYYDYKYDTEADGVTPKKINADGTPVATKDDKQNIVYKFDSNGNPIVLAPYIWEKNSAGKLVKRNLKPEEIKGGNGENQIRSFIKTPIFVKDDKIYVDETITRIAKKTDESAEDKTEVFSHRLNKWVEKKDLEFTEFTAIFHSNYQGKLTNQELIELSKEMRTLNGIYPQEQFAVSSGTPSISVWNKAMQVPVSEFSYTTYGSITFNKEAK
ncbi:OppA family ABC transporter substrate-binding lipoprotein [Mycoplasma procyoni]|uniref:OppA family ABC transporter substrate-binding lipoprotein n=1 Tax=Mycoplasma procyoni TaxID=568784 RepID=UPI00197B0922|nr:hypothetical protein [Mycoplasma procyoni]MBN3535100.1 hypothetical protein [Mycoplasma procyoni]